MNVTLRVLAIAAVVAASPVAHSASQQQNRHLYLYNECHITVTATADCGESANVKTVTESVPPGTQRLLCTSQAQSFAPTTRSVVVVIRFGGRFGYMDSRSALCHQRS